MRNVYKRWAIWLVICLVVTMFSHMGKSFAGSGLHVQLVITDTYVTHKTYALDKGRHRQLQVQLDNAFGTIGVKFSTDDKKIAGVTKKGYIEARKKGKVKIRVKVTCKSDKKKVTKKTWVQIKVTKNTEDPSATDMPYNTNIPIIITSATPVAPTSTPLPAITGPMQATMIINGPETAQYQMTILDNANGRTLYNSLPRVFYLTDRDKNTKTANEENYESGYTRDDEYKPGTLTAGDFMLYGVDRYELIYKDHKTGYAYSRLARIQNPAGLETALGTGAVSVTIIKSVLPTEAPSYAPGQTPASGVTPPVIVTQQPPVVTVTPITPVTSLPPGTSATPTTSFTPPPIPTTTIPGQTTSPGASSTPGLTPTPVPTAYSGNGINITINGQILTFIPNSGSSVAEQFYNELKTGVQQYSMIEDQTYGNRYYAALSKTYTETRATNAPNFPVGSLVLMGNNEINVYVKNTPNSSSATATLLGTLDRSGLPEGRNLTDILKDTYFNVPTVAAQFSAQ